MSKLIRTIQMTLRHDLKVDLKVEKLLFQKKVMCVGGYMCVSISSYWLWMV